MSEGTRFGTPHYLPHQIVWRVLSSGISAPVIEPIVTPPGLVGKLTLHILKARRLHNVRSFGTMDVYVEAKIGETRAKTSVVKRGHVAPEWGGGSGSTGEKLEFLLNGTESLLRLRVFHKTLLSSEAIGTARLPLDYLLLHHGRSKEGDELAPPINCANPNLHTAWIDIGRDNRQSSPAGSVLVAIHFELLSRVGLLAACTMPGMENIGANDKFVITPDPSSAAMPPPPANGTTAAVNTNDKATLSVAGGTPPLSSSPSPFRLRQRAASTTVPSLILPGAANGAGANSHHRNSISGPVGQSQSASGSALPSSSSASAASSGTPRPQLFGASLANGMSRSKSSVPVVVFVCIRYLTYHGLKSVGLFRISGASESADVLRRAFEQGSAIELSDPHVTADVLKSYFRQLSDPLIPSNLFQSFLNATDLRREEESIPLLRSLLDQLPHDNMVVLNYLIHFLTQVASYSEVNKMTPKNLALVWSPNILRKTKVEANETQASMAKEMAKSEVRRTHKERMHMVKRSLHASSSKSRHLISRLVTFALSPSPRTAFTL